MTLHIGAQPGEIAQTVLMPGDPLRAKWAAAQFLSDARCVSQTRGMLAYTGTWQGHRVSIHASGVGMASMSIYAHELLREYGARTLIRVGSTGAMQDHVNLRDIVLAQACTTISTPSQPLFREVQFAPCADFGLLRAAHDAACAQGAPVHVGNVYSSDVFYDERPDLNAVMTRHGVLAVEMEAAELYCVAARFKARALAVLTVSDHLPRDEHLTPADREQSFGQMFEIALHAAFA